MDGTGGLAERVIRALRLDVGVYRDVSADRTATSQAFRVVLLAGLSNGLSLGGRLGGLGLLAGIGAALVGWLLWTGTILLVARLFGHTRTGSLLRALGFANAPGLLLIAGIVPRLGGVIRLAVVGWLLAATVVAVQAVFTVPRRRAIVISVAGFAVYLVLGIVSAQLAAS
jgi:hypothetical protein